MSKALTPEQRYLAADKERALNYQRLGRCPETLKNDRLYWKRFSAYLGSVDPWKASPEDIAAWCAHLADSGYSLSYIRSGLASLSYRFMRAGKGEDRGRFGAGTLKKNPVRSAIVRSTMRGIQIVHRRMPDRKAPIMLETLEKLLDLQPTSLTGLRNRAMLSLTWAAALRASEVVSMDMKPVPGSVGYIELLDEGTNVAVLRRNSPRGELRWETHGFPLRASVPQYCPTRLLKEWLNHHRATEGPLFPSIRLDRIRQGVRINRHTLIEAMRPGLCELGLPPGNYASRSLRAGCVSWMLEEGVALGRVMEHSGYRRPESIIHHVQSVSAVRLSPLAETSWLR